MSGSRILSCLFTNQQEGLFALEKAKNAIAMAGFGIAITLMAGAPAGAVSYSFDFEGFSQDFGGVEVVRDTASGSGDLSVGDIVRYAAPFSFLGYTDQSFRPSDLEYRFSLTVDDIEQTADLSQSISVSGRERIDKRNGLPLYSTSVNVSPATDAFFEFSGIGTFYLNVDDARLFETSNTLPISEVGSAEFSIQFYREDQPAPDPTPAPIPLPAGLPLLLGGLGAMAFVARRANTRK